MKRPSERQTPRLHATRLTADESEALTAAAIADGVSISTYLRRLVQKATYKPCELCHDTGRITRSQSMVGGYSVMSSPCPKGCHGPYLMNTA